ncbi:MAG: hypothetical protein V7K77_29555 [Nostoc sp.]|uniref:hypothetical protein n=1 Tax=Nostoc sp. TaxID=1180 RepID=UPI002FFC8BF6
MTNDQYNSWRGCTSLRDAPRTTTQFDCAHRKLSDHANDYAVVESRLLLTETLRERSITAKSKLSTSD